MKSHLDSYPCPLNLNYFWNLGFLLVITILLQMITGILLSLDYTSDIHSAYYSVIHIIREIYYGWCLRSLHSCGASFVFLILFIHIGRAISYGSNFYNPNTWFSGIILFLFLMATAFMGYVLPWGQMSFWGATVITNLLSPFPCLIEWVCGGQNINQKVDTKKVNDAISNNQNYKIGKAEVVRGGSDVTLVTWGAMLHLAKQAADILSSEGIEVEIIDLRTIIPFDAQTCVDSVMRTGRLVILQEGQWSGGLGHTIQSRILESCFYALESAPCVIGALDTPVPFSPPLENHTIPSLEHVLDILRTSCN